ncbi:MAG: flippase-like domain-containing protein [Flavobacteriaceae bacterium]|nr:flippase-like domain-containing protein [Flavobacteriaceae bacterium]
MKKKIIHFLKIALPLLLGIFLIWYSYNKFSPEQLQDIRTHFQQANYGYVALSILFGILSNISRAIRWGYLFEPMGYKLKFSNKILAVYITYLMNLFIPRSGEISRALVVNKYENVPFDKAFGTIISERAFDFFILLIFIGVTISLQFPLISGFFQDENFDLFQVYVAIGVAVPVLFLAFYFLKKSNSTLSQKIKTFISGLKEGVLSIFKMKQKWAFLGHTLFIWLMYICMFYVMIFALPETSGISIPAILTAFVVGSLTIAFTNGGFGSYPFFTAALLLLFDVPETAGTAFGWLVWTSQTVAVIILGGLSFLLLPVLNKAK